MADPSFGEIVSWAFILGALASTPLVAAAQQRGPAVVAATLAALTLNLALLHLT